MGKFVLGAVFGVIVLMVVVVGYFLSGLAPVATDAPPMPLEKFLAKKALHAVLDRDMPKTVPIPANEPNYLAGAQVYKDNCAVCHGLPGQPATAIARGMFPKPPELMKGKGVTDDEPGETYWKVAHGIRLTGMPGFQGSLTDTQTWQVSLLLANADKLPDSVKASLATPAPPTPPPNVKGVL
jgi:mono/diheme cytochrome c family protein